MILEYSTRGAGELDALKGLGQEISLGVVNPGTADVESVEHIIAQVREAARLVPESKIFLNPDCGPGPFAQRPMNDADIATEKLRNIVKASEKLRHG